MAARCAVCGNCLLYTSLLTVAGPDRACEHQVLKHMVVDQTQRIGGVDHQRVVACSRVGTGLEPVSYTHLDVYKRQVGQLEGGGGELGLLALIDVLDHRAQANVGVSGVLACGLEQVVGQVRIDH